MENGCGKLWGGGGCGKIMNGLKKIIHFADINTFLLYLKEKRGFFWAFLGHLQAFLGGVYWYCAERGERKAPRRCEIF